MYRRVQKESDDIIVYGSVTRYGPQSIASATWLTSCAEKTHVYNFLSQIATFSQFSVYLSITQVKQIISLLLNLF